jgi:hypothetical protein
MASSCVVRSCVRVVGRSCPRAMCHVDSSAFLVVVDVDFLLDFRVPCHRPVVVVAVRKTLLLVEVLVDSVVATVVSVVVVVLVAEVVPVVDRPVAVVALAVLVVAVDVAAVGVVVLDPWEYIP